MRKLALFARAVRPGAVKTRLAPALPVRAGATLYAGLLADAREAVFAAAAERRYVYWADEPGPAAGRAGLEARVQRGAHLGERLEAVFADLLRTPGDVAVVVGSDTLGLAPSHLDAALAALAQHDVVVGPARDGGYWCIGLRAPAPGLFRDVPWSTRRVLEVTLERARAAGLGVAMGAELVDLDTPEDLARLVGRIGRGEPAAGPQTRAALEALGLLPAHT